MAQGFSFSRIDVEGNKRIETSTIVTYSGLATDQVFGADDLNRAYQNILASGLFESVEVVPNGNRLIINVNEFPTVNKIAFEGNRRVNDNTLKSTLDCSPAAYLILIKLTQIVRQLYRFMLIRAVWPPVLRPKSFVAATIVLMLFSKFSKA